MKHSTSFGKAIILGDGFAARLTALVLSQALQSVAVIGPRLKDAVVDEPHGQSGHAAHSHIFLPRLEQELTAVCPELLARLNDAGIAFESASARLRRRVPPSARRAFATRWQVDQVLEQLLSETPADPLLEAHVLNVECQQSWGSTAVGSISVINCSHGRRMTVSPQTLVVDACGSNSPVMLQLQSQQPQKIDQSSHIAYLTQFFRQNSVCGKRLPDPLTECVQDFGGAVATLYPGSRGWYSVTLALDARHRSLLKSVRSRDQFLDVCHRSAGIKEWLNSSEPVGQLRTYINPHNRWNVDAFADRTMPPNYIAVGDSLVTSCPALGAGCSFAATHIRVMMQTIGAPIDDFHPCFAQEIQKEQFSFFLESLARQPPSGLVILSQDDLKAISRLRIMKKSVGRFLGLERIRLIRQLKRTSSL